MFQVFQLIRITILLCRCLKALKRLNFNLILLFQELKICKGPYRVTRCPTLRGIVPHFCLRGKRQFPQQNNPICWKRSDVFQCCRPAWYSIHLVVCSRSMSSVHPLASLETRMHRVSDTYTLVVPTSK